MEGETKLVIPVKPFSRYRSCLDSRRVAKRVKRQCETCAVPFDKCHTVARRFFKPALHFSYIQK